MKKTISLIFSLLLVLILVSCGEKQGESMAWQETPTVPQTNESLTVFCMDGLKDSSMIKLALKQYQALYPDTRVELLIPGSAIDYEIYQQVAAQVMAGEGPDVFIIDDTVMDVEKLVRQGIFADMEPFFQADDFDWSPYNQTIMDGGVWNGKRFTIPLGYDFPLLITTREALEETGFDMEKCKDYRGFLEETTRYMENLTRKRRLFHNPLTVVNITEFSGLSIADYDAKTIDLSSPVFQEGFQWYKTVMETHPNGTDLDGDWLTGAAAVRDGNALWTPSLMGALHDFYGDFGALKTTGDAVMMPVRDLNGGIQASIKYPVAVRANSENLQNAYDYIKILLSPEVQCTYSGEELSVLNSANEYFYQENIAGRWLIISAGTQGFVSSTNPLLAIDWPTPEEFQEFVGFTQEITGTYYYSHLRLYAAMRPYVYENMDFEEARKAAQRQLEINITE